MTFRTIAICIALAIGLMPTMAKAATCEGAACRTAAKSKPLELGKFMKRSVAKQSAPVAAPKQTAPVAAKQSSRAAKNRDRAFTASRRPPPPAVTMPEPVQAEAAEAYASQPDVRVVSGDEVNEIDLAAPALPTATDGSGQRTENGVQFVDASEYNDIDRKSDLVVPAAVAAPPASSDVVARNDQADPTWIERLWTTLHGALVALGSFLWRIAG
jgi:hypothetical protein